jgi:hypothetical protein
MILFSPAYRNTTGRVAQADCRTSSLRVPLVLDSDIITINNSLMSTEIKPTVDTDDEALMQRVLHGKPLDPAVYRRIRQEGDRITEEIRRQHGTIEIAVDLIREIRDEE